MTDFNKCIHCGAEIAFIDVTGEWANIKNRDTYCVGASLNSRHQIQEKTESKDQYILRRAAELIGGDRRTDYGSAEQSFEDIANMWSTVLNHVVTSYEVALCMIALKLCRARTSSDPDSLIDMAGYAGLAHLVRND